MAADCPSIYRNATCLLLPPVPSLQLIRADAASWAPACCMQDLWGKVMWVWDRPDVQKLRLTIFMANFRCDVDVSV